MDFAGAVRLSGYTHGHLRRLFRSGQLRNVGTEAAPAFIASELPRKPTHPLATEILVLHARNGVNSRVQVARAVVSGD